MAERQHKMKQHAIKDAQIAVYVPNEQQELKLEIGKATLKAGVLMIEFNDRLPAQAIQRLIANDILMAVTLVPVQMVQETSAEESTEEKEKN